MRKEVETSSFGGIIRASTVVTLEQQVIEKVIVRVVVGNSMSFPCKYILIRRILVAPKETRTRGEKPDVNVLAWRMMLILLMRLVLKWSNKLSTKQRESRVEYIEPLNIQSQSSLQLYKKKWRNFGETWVNHADRANQTIGSPFGFTRPAKLAHLRHHQCICPVIRQYSLSYNLLFDHHLLSCTIIAAIHDGYALLFPDEQHLAQQFSFLFCFVWYPCCSF